MSIEKGITRRITLLALVMATLLGVTVFLCLIVILDTSCVMTVLALPNSARC
ncbi:hypothetical protein LINPERPRIM_LOCUS32593 [Linum perenne]